MVDVYEIITDKIIEYLDKGIIPWHKPWKFAIHQNMFSQRSYNGINVLLLNSRCALKGYKSPFWLTYNQVKKLGGSVKKGENSTLVTFWKIREWETKKETGDLDDQGNPIMETVTETKPLLRYYRVFNIEQTKDIPKDKIPVLETKEHDPIARGESIIRGMSKDLEITYTDSGAWYNPTKDIVNVPDRTRFETIEDFYNTMFHELGHSTGHSTRLQRFNGNVDETLFGSRSYSKEELVAELTASFLSGDLGIEETTIKNSAGYIQSWIKKLKNDKKLIVMASAKAKNSAGYILEKEDKNGIAIEVYNPGNTAIVPYKAGGIV